MRARAWLERPWRERWRQLERDLAMLGAGFRGERTSRPSSWARGGARAGAAPATGVAVRKMVVREVVPETADAVTLVLADPRAGNALTWRAGEFLTLGVPIDGRVERRAYSLCVPPPAAGTDAPAVTVKRVAGGKVSGWLVAHAAPGLELEVGGPSGRFVFEPRADAARHHVLIGGGSGITPLAAILETVLRDEPGSSATLVYGNRGAPDVIFAARLGALAAAHAPRLAVVHALSEPPADWTGAVGMLDAALMAALVPADGPHSEYWICGPAPMMEAAARVLAQRGVPPARVHSERFLTLGRAAVTPSAMTPQRVRFRRAGVARESLVAPGRTLLEAGLAAGLPMPHSCTLGGCGACRVRVVAGDVVHDEPNCLGSDEAAAGFALACVARPLGPVDIEVPA